MLENGHRECKSEMSTGVEDKSCSVVNDEVDKLTYKLVRVEGDGSFIPASEDDVLEVEHLLAEPNDGNIFVDACFEPKNSENRFTSKQNVFPLPDDYCQIKINGGGLDSDTVQEGRQEPKFEFLNGISQGIDGEGIHATMGLSSECADYFLDDFFTKKASHSDNGSWEGPDRNLYDEDHSTSLGERDGGAAELSDLSSPMFQLTGQGNLLLDKMTIRELHETFRSTFGRETSVKDKQWLKRRILFGMQNLTEFENMSTLLESGPSSNETEDDLIFNSSRKTSPQHKDVGEDVLNTNFTEGCRIRFGGPSLGDKENAIMTPKRQRKPTRRYIEESSDVRSRHNSGKLESPITNSRDKILQVKSHNQQYHQKEFGKMELFCTEDSLAGRNAEVHWPRRGRGRPRKSLNSSPGYNTQERKEQRLICFEPSSSHDFASQYESSHDDEMSDGSNEAGRTGKAMRRKHHRLWNLSEVMKLIEGVSRYGVGRWTDIKRLLFAASSHRTSVDLKDKWRNLLRASCVQMPSKKEVEQRKKHSYLPIPQSVLRQVRELAVIYPYPRERKSKLVRVAVPATTPTSISPPISPDASVRRSGRVVHRKSFV